MSGEFLLIGPSTGATVPGFPALLRVALYIKLTGAHGTYQLAVDLRDQDGQLVAHQEGHAPLSQPDPLTSMQISWRDVNFWFPHPGRYDLILLANGEDLTHHALDLRLKTNVTSG